MRRWAILLALVMAVVLVVSAPMADAKTVYCPNRSDGRCVGTTSNDLLIVTKKSVKSIEGKEGNDYYYVSVSNFGNLEIQDSGGRRDVLDLRRYSSRDFDLYRIGDDLFLDGPGSNNVRITNFFSSDSIDYFVFSNRTITVDQATSTVQEASSNEEAAIQQQLANTPIGKQTSPASSKESTS